MITFVDLKSHRLCGEPPNTASPGTRTSEGLRSSRQAMIVAVHPHTSERTNAAPPATKRVRRTGLRVIPSTRRCAREHLVRALARLRKRPRNSGRRGRPLGPWGSRREVPSPRLPDHVLGLGLVGCEVVRDLHRATSRTGGCAVDDPDRVPSLELAAGLLPASRIRVGVPRWLSTKAGVSIT